MAPPRDVYDLIIEPIRTMDRREGLNFLFRWLRGVQEIWRQIDEGIIDVPKLWSVTDCPDGQLQFLKWIVGWTSELEDITRELTEDELRRLISISAELWKERGSDDALIDVLYFATGARCRYWNWFDFRWVLDETQFGEEHQGRDPWLVDLPDPDVSGSEYESNLRIVDDGALNRTLVVKLVEQLLRATGERWDITYLGLLDQFLVEGDDSQWLKIAATDMIVANGVMSLINPTLYAGTLCVVPSAIWPEAMYSARVRTVGPTLGMQILFNTIDINNYYALNIIPEGSGFGPTQIQITKSELGSPSTLVTVLLSAVNPIHPGVYYTFRIVITNEGAVGKRIKVYIDGNEFIDYLDDPSLLPEGTMGFVAVQGGMDIDEAEVALIPQDQPPQRAVPVPFVTEWTVAGDAAARTITLPLVQNRAEDTLNYDFIVDWGDGTTPSHVTAWNDSNRVHTYGADGTYQVSIRGQMEGWSLDGGSDASKLVRVVQWGKKPWFQGFAYLKNGFKGCSNLTSIQGDPIPAHSHWGWDDGVFSDGFEGIFYGCSSLTELYADLFDEHVNAENFKEAFRDCTGLIETVDNLFYHQAKLDDYAFAGTFRDCTGLVALTANLFACESNRNKRVDYAWQDCFRGCTGLTTIPPGGVLDGDFTDLGHHAFASCFRGCTGLTTLQEGIFQGGPESQGWQDCFRDCTGLTSLPGGLFGNGGGTGFAFERCFRDCTGLTTIGTGLFYYNDAVGEGGFNECFRGCSALESVPNGLFKTNESCGGFVRTFYECVKLQLNEWIFYDLSNKFDRFKGIYYGWIDFTECFYRSSFSGTAGKAPELWFGDFDEIIQALPVPTVDWVFGDHIEGQTSGHDLYINGARIGATNRWPIERRRGTFQLDEVIGVTGVPSKLADQDATHPQWENSPTTATCYSGAGNDASSITNYGDIPNNWL